MGASIEVGNTPGFFRDEKVFAMLASTGLRPYSVCPLGVCWDCKDEYCCRCTREKDFEKDYQIV